MPRTDRSRPRHELLRERAELLARVAELDLELDESHECLGASLTPAERDRLHHRMLDGGWDVVTLVGADLRFVYVSGSIEHVAGYTCDELIGASPLERVHPDDRGRFTEAHRALLATPGARASCTYRFLHKSGEYVWVETVAANLQHDPALRGILATSRDVTERRRAEEALAEERAELEGRVAERTAELARANEALVQSSRAKDEFLASMSHELRTPLNGVLGIAEALEEGVYGDLGPRQRKSVGLIRESGSHLLALIEDILDLSKLEAHKLELAPAPLSVAEICRASLRIVEQTALRRGQRLGLALADDFAAIEADERRLRQILVNLLSNAVKFTPDRGGIDLSAAPEGTSEIRFTVADTGIGIAAADLPRLFQPFVQIDSSLSRKHAGTGLGLALVRKLAELHGGRVEVESEPGKGSRFSVILPARRARPAPAREEGTAAAPAGEPARRARLLLAEDDENGRSMLVEFLGSRGYDVEIARDGAEAIAKARASRFDLIVMDVQMPHVDGLTATRVIRGDPALRDVPIVALTALAMGGDREACLAAGATAYVSKPVRLRGLAELVGEILSRGA